MAEQLSIFFVKIKLSNISSISQEENQTDNSETYLFHPNIGSSVQDSAKSHTKIIRSKAVLIVMGLADRPWGGRRERRKKT
jgi:hypothetical protein